MRWIKFIYSEKAIKFCEIFPLLLTVCTVVKSKGKISQNFVAFSEYMNFNLKEEGAYYSNQIVEESYESLNELASNYDQFEAYDCKTLVF